MLFPLNMLNQRVAFGVGIYEMFTDGIAEGVLLIFAFLSLHFFFTKFSN